MTKSATPPAPSRLSTTRICILVAVGIWFLYVAVHQYNAQTWFRQHKGFSAFKKETKKVLIRESQGYHDEVYASFFSSLSGSSKVQTSMTLKKPRFNMEQITNINEWVNAPHLSTGDEHLNEADALELNPDILIAITCGDDLQGHAEFYESMFTQTSAILYCVVHHAERYQQDSTLYSLAKQWIRADRIRLITLSKHVQESLAAEVGDVPLDTFPPIFETNSLPSYKFADSPYFALQGNIDFARRDYSSVFDSLRKGAGDAKGNSELTPQLYILGSGSLDQVPQDIVSLVQIKSKLEYPDFYTTLANAVALLPSFATDDYYVNKASSSVPASIISGSPLVVSQKLLDTYTYLNKDSVILKEDNESEFDAATRFMNGPALARSRVAANLLALRRNLIRQNSITLDKWITADTS